MSKDQNHYRLLDVPRNADLDTIKQAYREQIRRHHPDQLAGERARLARGDDIKALRAIERRIADSKKITQRINTAYAVLSDSARRREYDKQLDKSTDMAAAYERRTTKSRPHHHPDQAPTLAEEATPWVMMAILFVGLVIISYGIRGFLIGVEEVQQARPTAIGLNAIEIQATQNMDYATEVVRTQRALRPTSTPRLLTDVLAAADALFELGSYSYAIEQYTQVIADDAQNINAHFGRGLAYAALFAETDETSDFAAALIDFENTLQIDDAYMDVLRERGLLYYARWQDSALESDANNALTDLEAYTENLDTVEDNVVAALADLRE